MKPKTKKSIVLFASLALVLGFAAAELQKSVRVVVSTGTAKGMPDVAYDAQAERYLVVWQERTGSGDDHDIRARVVSRDGTPASDVVALASSGEDERLPKTAATGSSSWTVVWSTGASIEVCTVDATGRAADFRTATSVASRPVDRPDIGAASTSGAFLVVWEELDETGLTVIKGRHIQGAAGMDGEEFLLARSPEHDLRNPSVNQSGSGSFIAWEKPVEVRRTDIEGRFVPADAASPFELGDILAIAADGAQNTLPSVTAYSEADAFLVVWQNSDGRRDSDISFASVSGTEVQASGKLTDTPNFRETRPFASSVGIAGRALVTYQTAPSNRPRMREIAARTIGWGDQAASAEVALDPTRAGGGNPASVPASGAGGRGLVVWDVREGVGTDLYSREWLASDLSGDGLGLDIDGPIVPLADVTISGVVTFNGIAQADVLMSGFPVETRTDATGAYSGMVATPWSGTVIPVQPGFTFSPASNTYSDVNAAVTGQNYTATYVGGAEDIYEDNDNFASAAELPLGTTHDLILNDEDWFKILVSTEDAGKDLKIRIWGTGFPDMTTRRDLDFAILDPSGKLLTYNTSGLHDETAYVCDAVEGYYYIVQTYVPEPVGTVYSVTAELSDTFGLGYVTGQVTDDDGTPIEGVTVELLGVTVDWWTVNNPLVYTDAGGNYKIGWYPGQYTIRLNGSDFGNDGLDWTPDENYLAEMYNWGEVVTLASGVTLPGIDAALTPGGVIAGRITDGSGNPFPYVYNRTALTYAHAGDTSRLGYSYADANGEYVIDRLRTGNYAVRLRTTDGPLINEWHNDQALFASADPVGAEAEIPTLGVDAMLEERTWGTIEGRVTDGNGDPVGNLQVAIYDPVGISIWTVRTDGEGNYHHYRVPAGEWKVYFNAASINTANLVSQYHPGTRFIGDAATVQVVTGETTDGIDATLAAAGSIAGQVLNNAGAVNLIAFDTASDFSASVTLNPILPDYGPPTYTINNLAPGTYKVLARPSSQGERMLHWYPDAASYADAGTVTVAAGAVTSGIDITLATGGALITGRVLDTGGYPIAGVVVAAQDASKPLGYTSAASNDEGYYTIRQVPVPTGTAGAVKVYFNADANGLGYVSEYYDHKVDHSTANTVMVNEGDTTTVPDAALDDRLALAIATSSLPGGELAVAYSQPLAATGGRTFYRWEIASGTLPDGLEMRSGGLITGVPTSAGSWSFTVRVTDSTLPQQSVTQPLSITVGAYTGVGYTISGTVTADATPLAGVTMSGLPGSPVTSVLGAYIAVVSSGWNGTVTPVRSGYAFTPASMTYANLSADSTAQDYTAVAGYMISGTVTLGGVGQAGVVMAGLPGEPWTDAAGGYAVTVPAGWDGAVTPTLPGFTFAPASIPFTEVSADMTGQNFVSTYAGGVDDSFEDNDSFATAAEVPLGTTSGLVLRDEDWFKVLIPAEDAGKDLRVHIWGTAYPDQTTRRDVDFGILDAAGNALSFSQSGSPDETAYICDIAAGWYYIAHQYVGQEGTVYSLAVDTNDDFGLAYISGTVRDDGNNALPGVNVELYGVPFNWDVTRPLVITDAAGNYKIGWVPGDYQVEFNITDWSRAGTYDWLPDANYLGEVYNAGEVLTLTAGATLSGIDGQLTEGGAITGTVTDASGNPFLNAWVYAHAGDTVVASYSLTSGDGHYVISRLRTGNYAVRVRPTGTTLLAVEWYDDAGSFAESMPIPVVVGTTTGGIDASFGNPGSLSGYVRNGTGEPIPGVTVGVYDPAGIGIRSGVTDETGHYFVGTLPTGAFKVQFNAATAPGGNYASEYYFDQRLIADAVPVEVTAGGTTTGIDAVLDAGGTISGTVTSDGNAIAALEVCAFAVSGDFSLTTTTNEMGLYTIRNVPAGDYKVRFRPATGDLAVEWNGDKADYTTANALAVDVGQDVIGVDADLSDVSATITGRVTDGFGAGIAGVTVVAQDTAKTAAYSSAITDGDGNYSLGRLPTCLVKILFNPEPAYLQYANEYHNDKLDHVSADAVSVTAGEITSDINAMLIDRPALAITTESLPGGQQAVAYSAPLAASGGRTLYHWSLESGALPDGLTGNGRGEISGTPTMTGTFTFTVRVSDSTIPQQVTTKELSITIGEYTGVGYTISGTVTADATPLAGVTMSGLPGSPVTNVAGGYIAVVPSGWTGTVAPIRSGYAFTPATISYANVSADSTAQDYTAVAGYTISGTVTLGGVGQAGVVMAGLPGEPWTDAAGGYAVTVPAGWDGAVTPTLPGFTFAPASIPFTDVSVDMTGQNFVSTYDGGVDDTFEDNDSFETAAVVPLGTTSGLVLRDEDWFKFYVAPGDAGKDLRVRIWGTSFPDATSYRDIDFYVRNAAGTALSLNLSGSPDETAYICDVAEGWYYVGQTYIGLEGTVYSLSVDLNEDFGLGYIEGTVRDDGGTPIPGVSVEFYREPFDWNISRPLIYTDAAGHYRIGYTPGAYSVRFNLASAERDSLEWTPDANYIGEVYHDGELIPIAAGTTTSGIDGQLSPGGAITGTVTDASGNPFLNAWVYAHAGDTVVASYSLTSGDGHYVISRLRTGNYAMRFRPTGAASLAVEWYDDAASFAEVMPVAVAVGATTPGIDSMLGTMGAIAGRVTNGSGEPIVGVQVTAYDPAGIALQSGNTDESGNYFVGRLPTGSFKVLFNAAPAINGNYVTKYYPDTFYLNDADYIDVVAGGPTNGIDGVLAAAGTITGTVTDGDGLPRAGVGVHAFSPDGYFVLAATTDATGAYSIMNLPPDHYRVRFRPATDDLTVEWNDDKADFTGADVVSVGAGATVSGIDAVLSGGGGLITGRVTNSSGAPIVGLTVVAQDTAVPVAFHSTVTDADGNYTLGRMPTGQAKVWFNADATYLNYFSEYHNDQGDHGIADAVTVTAGETTSGIDAVLAEQPALTVTTGGLAIGELAVEYASALESSGGRPFYHWSLESGTLPDGLTLNGRGEISGTPTMAGTFMFTVRVSDSTAPQQVATQEFSITIGEYAGIGHSISGRVMLGGAPLSGVTMTDLPGTPTTNSAGSYVAVVPDGWSGTVTPSLAEYVFTPATRTYDNVTASLAGQDYAVYIERTLSGTVRLGEAGLAGVLMSGLPESPMTGADGTYAAAVPDGWSGTVTPTLEGYTFTPATRPYTEVTANFADQDYAATAAAPTAVKVDFNGDGQEDILWRYHGAGGYNRAWFLGNTEPIGLQASNSIPARTVGDSDSGKSARFPRDMGIVSGNKNRSALRVPRNLMGVAKKSAARARVTDPRRAGGMEIGLAPQVLADPRQAKSLDAPIELASTPALLGGGDVMPVDDLSWQIVGTGDFNNDTHVDILWRNSSSGSNVVWFMNGTDWAGSAGLMPVADLAWQIVGTGDFNRDTHVDILWRNSASGDNVVWYMNGTNWTGSAGLLGVSDQNWRIVGTGDFNNDGNVDLLWRYEGAGGYNVVWHLENATWTGSAELIPVGDTAWQIVGTGDYNMDGSIDILWRYHGAGGYNVIWYMNGVAWSASADLLPVNDLTWRIVSR